METCPWITRDNKVCNRKCKDDSLYCSLHKHHEGVFTRDDIKSIKYCSRCKALFKDDTQDPKKTQCESCIIKKGRHIKCGWINQKGKPCPWKAMEGMTYCKRHSHYEGVFTPEDIPTLAKCSGCKNMFKPDGENKMCPKCVKRSHQTNIRIKNERDARPICKAIVKRTGLPCTHHAIRDSEYCGEHQSVGKWKKLTDNGKTICSNWIRNCWNGVSNGYSRCEDCRRKERKSDKIRRTDIKKVRVQEQSSHFTNLTCTRCNIT
jgi:hypothetical protein